MRALRVPVLFVLIIVMGILMACSGHNPLGPSDMATSQIDKPGTVHATSVDYGVCHLRVLDSNITDNGRVPDDGVIRIRVDVGSPEDGCDVLHLAAFLENKPVGSQDLAVDPVFKYFVAADRSITITLQLPTKCGISYQIDLGIGKNPPHGAAYGQLLAAWHIGNPCGSGVDCTPTPTPAPTPVPTATPTPHCNVSFAANNECNPTPTPAPTATPTPDPCGDHGELCVTPTPVPTSTPTPVPTATPTPVPTPTPDPWDKSSLAFGEGCTVSGNTISVTICNEGTGNMAGTAAYQVFYAAHGAAKNGSWQANGIVPQMISGACSTLTYSSANADGNYQFEAFQRSGHPGIGSLWSATCSVH